MISIQMYLDNYERLVRFWNFVKIPAGSNATTKFVSPVEPPFSYVLRFSVFEIADTKKMSGSTRLRNLAVTFE